jgi:hypothetical protein
MRGKQKAFVEGRVLTKDQAGAWRLCIITTTRFALGSLG